MSWTVQLVDPATGDVTGQHPREIAAWSAGTLDVAAVSDPITDTTSATGASNAAQLQLGDRENVDVAMLARLDNRIDELEDGQRELREKNQDLREANKRLRGRIAELEKRTDLLDLVQQSDEMDGMQRSVALLQHLRRKAGQEGERGRTTSAAVDREAAMEALHHPTVDRTTIYDDFRRCERLVGDTDVCHYDGGQDARLVLNLENGDVPAEIGGGGER